MGSATSRITRNCKRCLRGLLSPQTDLVYSIFIIVPPALGLLVMAVQRMVEVVKSLTPPDEMGSFPTFLKAGVVFIGVAASIGCNFSMGSFRAPVEIYMQENKRKILTHAIGLLSTAAGLALGASLESTFLPLSLPECENPIPSYLDVIGKRIRRSSGSVCKCFLIAWNLQVIITCIFGLMGSLALASFVDVHFVISRSIAGGWRYQNRLKERLRAEKQEPILLEYIAHCSGANPANNMDDRNENPQQITSGLPVQNSKAERLQIILSAYDIVGTIAAYCTCGDLKNLMLVSRGVRSAILGATSPRLLWKSSTCGQSHIRKHADANGDVHGSPSPRAVDKALHSSFFYGECIGCGKHLCKSCSTVPRRPLYRGLARHLITCRPCCSRCFEEHHCRRTPPIDPGQAAFDSRKRGPKFMPPMCECTNWRRDKPPREVGDIDVYMARHDLCTCCSLYTGDSIDHYSRMHIFIPIPITCKECAQKSDEQLLSLKPRVARNRRQVTYWNRVNNKGRYSSSKQNILTAEVIRVSGLNCLHCQEKLSGLESQRVWWVCLSCRGECGDSFHRNYA